jgi:pimeloyl-ACP methyl ester carboxylesterase
MEIVRVISVSYDYFASNWGKCEEVQKMETLGSNLVNELIHEGGKWWRRKNNKIVLVGHSFGGIVIKSLTVAAAEHAKEKKCEMCKTFLKHIKGMIFYAVPHSGTLIAQYVENFDKAFPHRLVVVLRKLKEFEKDMQQLSMKFDEILKLSSDKDHAPHGIKIYSFAERLKYNEVSSPSYFIFIVVSSFSNQECE